MREYLNETFLFFFSFLLIQFFLSYVYGSAQQSLTKSCFAHARWTNDMAHKNCACIALFATARTLSFCDSYSRKLIVRASSVISQVR